MVTKCLKHDKTNVKTKNFSNFLTKQDQKEEYVTSVEDKIWRYANIMLAQYLHTSLEMTLRTVHLDKYVDFYSEVYKMSSDTYGELVTLCKRYEESLMET